MNKPFCFSTEVLINSRGGEQVFDMKFGENLCFVASTGGHLEQLFRLWKDGQLGGSQIEWITFKHPQSENLLSGENVNYVPYIPSRGIQEIFTAFPKIFTFFRTQRPDAVVSTGAAIALPAMFAAFLLHIPFIYIESVSRFKGPSLSGRILSVCPWVRTYTQHKIWANWRWKEGPSVLKNFKVSETEPVNRVSRVFISLGTIKPYRFDRAVEALTRVIPQGVEVFIQYGETDREFPGWISSKYISADEFSERVQWADVVVTHSGVGSILKILDSGKRPVLLVRSKAHNEHVDNHQSQVADALSQKQLATIANLDSLTWQVLQSVTSYKIEAGRVDD